MKLGKKLLVIRMSSLGDVILSTSFLESLPKDTQVDWIISSDFAFVLKNHPRIQNLHVYDKKSGLLGWIKLIAKLSHVNYDQRVDLHVTLRSQIARFIFHWLDLSRGSWTPWKKISKQRFQFYGYLLFKKSWPKFLRPTPLWKRFATMAGGVQNPSMLFLLNAKTGGLEKYRLAEKKYFVVMPSSRWVSKEWGAESYFQLCVSQFNRSKLIPVILGRSQDQSAVLLSEKLKAHGIDHRSILSENDFGITASLIREAVFYVGSDTGLAHLAEAVGTRAFMIFGPTRPDLGFGPWRIDSASIFSTVFCAPCSKDGRICYRMTNRYACLKKISVQHVEEHLP